jgi:hypothetical protein
VNADCGMGIAEWERRSAEFALQIVEWEASIDDLGIRIGKIEMSLRSNLKTPTSRFRS